MTLFNTAKGGGAVVSNNVHRAIVSARKAGFPVRVLGQSNARPHPQRVGQWWLEPLHDPGKLPPRARQRLDAFLAAGVQPKALVIFHEIPLTTVAPVRPATVSPVERAAVWVHHHVPEFAGNVRQRAKQAGPHIGAALSATSVVLGWSAAAAVGLAALAVPIVIAAATDPCLVVVTEDGYWLEIDRWYD